MENHPLGKEMSPCFTAHHSPLCRPDPLFNFKFVQTSQVPVSVKDFIPIPQPTAIRQRPAGLGGGERAH